MSALRDFSDLGAALEHEEEVSEPTRAIVEDQIRVRLPAYGQLGFNVSCQAAERAHRHQQRDAVDMGIAGQNAYSNWSSNDFVWTAEDYRKLGFHSKYCTGLYV